MPIKTAVFPVAGLGSRFLPATKANPKEMLPIVDKPLIQYAVEEAVRAGINHMVFITSSSKRAIEDHFDDHFELEARLKEQGKQQLLDLVRAVSPPGVQFTYVRQNQALGLGHAILCAESVVGDSPFAVLLADDLMDESQAACLAPMMQHYQQSQAPVVAVQAVPWDKVGQYGVVQLDSHGDFARILSMIEKPRPEAAPSNLVAVGRYVFGPDIFTALKQTEPDAQGEIQLTDAIRKLLIERSVYAYRFAGKRYDCGSKLGYLQATVDFGRLHPEIGPEFKEYLQTMAEQAQEA